MTGGALAHALAHAEWTGPLALVCGLTTLAVAVARLRARRIRRRLAPAMGPAAPLLRDAALLVALFAIAVALLGPRLGEKVVRGPASGVDVVVLLDTSRSMDAGDVAPSRLARARRAASDLLARLEPGDRAALAVFASRGALLTPLTPDHGVLHELLQAVDTALVRPAGSHLGAGVRAAVTAFEEASERPRVLLVLSDGEDPERRSDLGIGAARAAGVRVLAAAFGSAAGAMVPDHGVPLRSPEGGVVISRRRSDRLERLASATGGQLLASDGRGDPDGRALAAALRRDAGGLPGEWVERRYAAVNVLPFAALAFLLLAGESVGRPIPRARPASRGRRGVALAASALLLLVGAGPTRQPSTVGELEARVAEAPGDPALLIELGVERLARGGHDAARRAFLAAAITSSDPSLAALAYYDLGVAALESGDLEAARDAFFDAVALAPHDREARFNLEWTLKALPGAPPAPTPTPTAEEPRPEDASHETAEPLPSETPRPAPAEPSRPEQAGGLGEAERRRWLGRVQDDLRRALRSAAAPPEGAPQPRGPAW